MAYKDFVGRLDVVRDELNLRLRSYDLFPQITELPVPEWLTQILEHSFKLPLTNEKSRSEFVVAPVLLAVRSLTNKTLSIYSGHTLNVAPERGLLGECDFILAKSEPLPILTAPVITLVEAKKQDIDLGLGQCAAQMLGAQIFNEQEGTNISTIYGCVTTGEDWQFMKLEGNELTFDNRRYYISNIGEILAVFQAIVQEYEN